MKIGIIVAMEKELRQLKKVLGNDPRFSLMQCGIGKVNAALGAQHLINEFRPDAIVSTGCAGGNGDDLQVQDVVVSTEVCYHDVYCGTAIDNTTQFGQVQGLPVRFKADPYLLSKSEELKEKYEKLSTLNWLNRHGRLVRGHPRENARNHREFPRCACR